jgi:hypothetical protein
MLNLGSVMKAFDAVMMLRDAARTLKNGPAEPAAVTSISPRAAQTLGTQLEATLTNVVVAALKEAFERDHARLELERVQIEEQKRQADEALRVEMRRHAADREVGRLRLLAGTALVGWIASVVMLAMRIGVMSASAKAAVAVGWLLLLGSLAGSFSAQSRVGAAVADPHQPLETTAGPTSLWLLIAGLGVTAASLLLTP